MVIDTSAIVAILFGEPEAATLTEAIELPRTRVGCAEARRGESARW
jgi:uncharacterized protein with PIN domain